MLKRLFRHPRTLAGMAWVIGGYLTFVYRTTRWRLEGAEHLAVQVSGEAVPVPMIVAFWHERLPLMSQLWIMARAMPRHVNRSQAAHVLVSQHRDGQFIGAIIRWFDLDVVLGSTSRGGATALRCLKDMLVRGDFVVITPDGPRGPPREAAPGVAQLAALSGALVLPCAAQTTRHKRLRTWDRMVLPLPFGRAVIVCGPAIRVPRQDWAASLPAITNALNAVSSRADAACAHVNDVDVADK